jgi:hypothetical protein
MFKKSRVVDLQSRTRIAEQRELSARTSRDAAARLAAEADTKENQLRYYECFCDWAAAFLVAENVNEELQRQISRLPLRDKVVRAVEQSLRYFGGAAFY